MVTQIEFGGIPVDVVRKDIKHVHLSVHPPTGKVRISAPERMDLNTIRAFAASKLGWIKRHQVVMREQERETPREFLERESHYVWGRRYLLTFKDAGRKASVELRHNRLVLGVKADASLERKRSVLNAWYRQQVHAAVPPLGDRWGALLGVNAERFFVQHMKTRWGSCNHAARTIRLNTELAKKPPVCLEYLVAHEMVHLIEPTHGPRFLELMDRFMPKWQHYRDELNRLPVRHEDWAY